MKALLKSRWMLLALLLLAVKGAFVLSLSDVFFYGEELEKGTAAKAMLDGLAVPHHQLAYHYYEGGGFVVSHMVAAAFLVVGQNLLAHKLVALFFQLAILAAGCLFARGLFGRAAAQWFGVLFVFGPDSYQKLSLINLGIHFEACLFLFGVLGLGGKLLFLRAQDRRDWFWLGVVTGLGLYFSYQVAIAAAWVALMLLIFKRKELIGLRGGLGLLGTAVGALPLLAMYALVGDAIFDIHGTAIGGEQGGPTNSVLFREFLASIYIDGSLGGRVMPFAWVVAFTIAGVFLIRRPEGGRHPGVHSRKLVTLYVLGYMALFSITYLSSGFVQGRAYHFFLLLRLAPLWVFAAVLVAGALGMLSESVLGAQRHLALVLGGVLVLLGVRASWLVLQGGRPTRLADNWSILIGHKGYSYDQYLAKVLPHFEGQREDKLRLVEGFDEDARALLRADATKNLYREEVLAEADGDLLLAWSRSRESLMRVADGDPQRLGQAALGLGALLTIGNGWNRESAFRAVAAAPESERAAAFEALGRFGGGGYPLPDAVKKEVQRGVGVPGAQAYWRGLGRWTYSLHRLNPPGVEVLVLELPEQARGAFREGFAAEMAWNRLR